MSALLRCFRQTLRDIFRQRETLTLLVGGSILYSFFYPTPYLNQVLRDLPVVVVDRDHTALSRQVTRWLDASEAARVSARSSDLSAAQDSVRAGAAGAVLLIPQDFERHLLRREPAYVEAYVDASYLLVYSTAMRAIQGVTGTLAAGISVRRPVIFVHWPLFNPLAGYAS